MRVTVDHRILRRFSEPQARVIQLLRLTPADTDHQSVVAWRVDIGCDARLRPSVDGYGNQTMMLYAVGPVTEIDLVVTGEVLTVPGTGVVGGTIESLPPIFYLRQSLAAPALDAVTRLAREAAGKDPAPLSQLHALNDWLHDRFDFRAIDGAPAEAPKPTTDLRGSAADAARLQIDMARTLGIPARFVSGYVAAESGDRGMADPHCWTEAWVDQLGWVAFDAMLGVCPADRHVRVAIALDPAGAPRISESRVGGGQGDSEVSLTVIASGGQS